MCNESEGNPPLCNVRADAPRRNRFGQAAQYLVVFGAAAAAAFGGLVAEDLLPSRDGWFENNFRVARIVGLVISLGLAAFGTWMLTQRRRNRGTLYYLRFQSETNPDFHERVMSQSRSEYLDFRSISAWCDPTLADVQKSGSHAYHVVDVRQQVNEMSAELQRAANDDSGESGFDIAPNLLFPTALALGYDWLPFGDVTLREFNGRSNKNVEDFQWKLHEPVLTGQGKPTMKSRIIGEPVQHYNARNNAVYRLTENTSYQTTGKLPSERVHTVWLEYRLSDRDYSGTPEQAKDRRNRIDRMSSVHKDTADVLRIIHVEKAIRENETDYCLVCCTVEDTAADQRLTVFQLTEGAAYWLARTLRDFPNAIVFIAGAIPKTVSFALGYMMNQIPVSNSQDKDPEYPWFGTDGTYHPWQRIIPMGHFLFEEPELRPMWVRYDQIDPHELITKAEGAHQ